MVDMIEQRETAQEMGLSERARRLKEFPPVQHLSLLDFVQQAQAVRLAGHGRGWEVMYENKSLGFADGTQAQALIQVHRREVNNALYAHDGDALALDWLWTELPTQAAVNQYPDLHKTFASAWKKLFGYRYFEVKTSLVPPGQTCFARLETDVPLQLVQGGAVGSRWLPEVLLIDTGSDQATLRTLLVRVGVDAIEEVADPARIQDLSQLWVWASRSDAVRQSGMRAVERERVGC